MEAYRFQNAGDRAELDAQRQYVVIGPLALLIIIFFLGFVNFYVSRAAAPKGAMPCKKWISPLRVRLGWGSRKGWLETPNGLAVSLGDLAVGPTRLASWPPQAWLSAL